MIQLKKILKFYYKYLNNSMKKIIADYLTKIIKI